jgi:hypothetical protein
MLPIVPLEAVSRILTTNERRDGSWAPDIDEFWKAQRFMFRKTHESDECGTHVHVTPGRYNKRYTIDELRKIAVGILRYEDLIQALLPEPRRHENIRHGFARRNSSSSENLRQLYQNDANAPVPPRDRRQALDDLRARVNWMDETAIEKWLGSNRFVVWNFCNTLTNGSGTIEFRGAPGVRDAQSTKLWVAFAVSFIDMLLVETTVCLSPDAFADWSFAALTTSIVGKLHRRRRNRCQSCELLVSTEGIRRKARHWCRFTPRLLEYEGRATAK